VSALLARSTGTVALVSLVGAQVGQTLVTGGRSPRVLATGSGWFATFGHTDRRARFR
jgi:hypothetical protein